jgi:hypothetical protein
VKDTINQKLARRKRRIDKKDLRGCEQPMMTARYIHYEIAHRNRGISHGGIGANAGRGAISRVSCARR